MVDQNGAPKLIHDLEKKNEGGDRFTPPVFFAIIAGALLLGGIVGIGLTKFKSSTGGSSQSGSKKVVGIADKKTFKDKAEGILKEGGVDGEGNFHLQRPGGESQNVYLTSTTVDLSAYINKKVRVWGETFGAQKAGWLMDVGLVEVL